MKKKAQCQAAGMALWFLELVVTLSSLSQEVHIDAVVNVNSSRGLRGCDNNRHVLSHPYRCFADKLFSTG